MRWCVCRRLIFALVVLFLLALVQMKLQHKLWLCLVLFLLLLPLAVLVIDHVYYMTFVGCFKVQSHTHAHIYTHTGMTCLHASIHTHTDTGPPILYQGPYHDLLPHFMPVCDVCM